LRFADPTNDLACVSASAEKDWLPVDLYVGGQEHAVLHLLYARFWHKVLHKIGVVSTPEPFQKVVHQGMILGTDGEKMSKSRNNVVNPDDIVNEFGADALRLYEMFMGPLEAVKPWQTAQVQGVVRFRDKVFQIVKRSAAASANSPVYDGSSSGEASECPELVELTRDMHKTIKKVTRDIDSMSFNTAISALMIYTNSLSAYKGAQPLPRALVENLVLLMSPIAPHCAEEFWEILGHEQSLMYHPWPCFEESHCVESNITVVIQVNGKKRGSVDVNRDVSQEMVIDMALEQEKIRKFITGKNVVKTIYVPGKIVNIVVKAS
jgi:leucyl-tRNA synthetase